MNALSTPSRVDAFDIVIVGGGAAGITVAAEMRRHRTSLSIAIVEPSDIHAYQPGWTLVGAGVFSMKQTQRREETLVPAGVTWIQARAESVEPEQNAVILADGRRLTYGSLVPLDPRVPRFSGWILKQNVLPDLVWNWMLKGSEFDIKHRERSFSKAA